MTREESMTRRSPRGAYSGLIDSKRVKQMATKNAKGVREGREETWKAENMRNEGVPNLKRVSLEGQEVKQNVSRRSGFNEL